jgi:hypothetical protein
MEKTGCKIDESCTSYNFGEGRKGCLQCRPMAVAASEGNHYHRGFVLDSELLEDIADNEKMVSIFSCLSHIEPEARAIFEDYQFSNISMNTIGKQRGMTRQQVYRVVRGVRHDIKKLMNLSTVF